LDTVICKCCEEECQVDGEYPKFFSWCDTCDTEPEGFDCLSYAADWMGYATDEAELLLEDR